MEVDPFKAPAFTSSPQRIEALKNAMRDLNAQFPHPFLDIINKFMKRIEENNIPQYIYYKASHDRDIKKATALDNLEAYTTIHTSFDEAKSEIKAEIVKCQTRIREALKGKNTMFLDSLHEEFSLPRTFARLEQLEAEKLTITHAKLCLDRMEHTDWKEHLKMLEAQKK